MGIKEKMDVTLNYVIKDFEGNIYLQESETIAVFEQSSIAKEFHKTINKTEGLLLIVFYVLFVFIEFFVTNMIGA